MSVAYVAGTARAILRDFPKYYEIEVGPLNVLTIRLPHPLISPESVQVFIGTPGVTNAPWSAAATDSWTLDDRNGLLKLNDSTYLNKRVLSSGYYYTWFTDSDLAMHAKQASDEVLYSTGGDYDTLTGVLGEVTGMGAVVRALWSLSLELMLDIDVSTPEGMMIPARQRYAQVLQMMQYFEGQYEERAAALNVGLGALEQFQLRRIAYLTNRYVPVYKPREVDNPFPPQRQFPQIPDGGLGPAASGALPDVIDVTENMHPPRGIRTVPEIGWTSIGTRGDYP